MPLDFKNERPPQAPGPPGPKTPAEGATPPADASAPRPSFMQRGKAAQEELERAGKRAKARAEKAGSTWRFYIPKEGGERRLTFLDGDLDEEGVLDIPMFYEHGYLNHGSDKIDVRCTRQNEPCPLCDSDDPDYVGVLTIIEWTEWEDKDKVKHVYRKRLYVAKYMTLQKLQQKATKYGGLTGVTFDVIRTGKRDARVGSDFDYVGRHTLEQIAGELEKPEHAQPCDYDKEPELLYRTADELVDMGLCKKPPVVGGKPEGGGLGFSNSDAAKKL